MGWPPDQPPGLLGDPVANLAEQLARLLRETQSPQRRSQWGRPASQGRRIEVPWQPGANFGSQPRGYVSILEAETEDTPQVLTVEIDPPYNDPEASFWYVRWATLRGEGARSNVNDDPNFFYVDYLPPWGVSIPMGGGRIQVEATGWDFSGTHTGQTAHVSVSLAPGGVVRSWEYDVINTPNIVIGGGGNTKIVPQRYSRRVRITCLNGQLQVRNTLAGAVLVTLAGGTFIDLPAFPYVLTTTLAAGPATFADMWETVRAT